MADKTTKLQLAALPQGIGDRPNDLVLAINDRLRRIKSAIGGGTATDDGGGSVPGPPGPPGPLGDAYQGGPPQG